MPTQPGTLPISRTASFDELSRRVKQAGLMEPRTDYYVAKIVFNLVLMAGCWAALFVFGDTWWQLVTASVLAGAFLQVGYIAHDAGHKQISTSKRRSELLGLVHMNLLMGVSYGWWVNHHNRHHNFTNNLDRDPDMVRRQVIFDVSELPVKATNGFRRFIIRFQSVMFFVLLGQEAWRLHAAGFYAARAGVLKRPRLELGLVLAHAVLYFVAVFSVLSPLTAVAFILVNQAISGLYLGVIFAPNHKGMAVYRSDAEPDWLHRQVLTSRNLRSSYLTDFLYGGLNYQIEHHLFPSMPRVNLRRARPIVMDYCRRHGIPYAEVSMWESYREVARYLAKVSDEARNGTRTEEITEE